MTIVFTARTLDGTGRTTLSRPVPVTWQTKTSPLSMPCLARRANISPTSEPSAA